MPKLIEGVCPLHSTVFITCSDSRLNHNLITPTEPGDLFLIRNVGNVVPPYGAETGSEVATIEYALSVLKMKNIVVCGHSHCGAIRFLMRQDRMGDLPSVRAWLSHAEAACRIVKEKYQELPIEAQESLAIEQNVLMQIDNLRTHPCVAEALARGDVNLFGWVYHIETGEMSAYDPALARFRPLSEGDGPAASRPSHS
jgi:carbonic anhydrase